MAKRKRKRPEVESPPATADIEEAAPASTGDILSPSLPRPSASTIVAIIGLTLLILLPVLYHQSRPFEKSAAFKGELDGDIPWSWQTTWRYRTATGRYLTRFASRDPASITGLNKSIQNLNILIDGRQLRLPRELKGHLDNLAVEKQVQAVRKGPARCGSFYVAAPSS